MLQPKFNPFFYAKFVFDVNVQKQTIDSSEKVEMSALEKQRTENRRKNIVDATKTELENWNYKAGQKYSFPDISFQPSIRVFTDKVEKYSKENMDEYMKSDEVKQAKTKEDLSKLVNAKLEKIAKHIKTNLLPEFYSIQEKRMNFVRSLNGKKDDVLKHFSNYFKTILKEDEQKKVNEEDLKNVVTALMNEFVRKNQNAIYKMTDDEIKVFNVDKANKLLEDDVAGIKKLVEETIVPAWTGGKERSIYKSKDWTQNDLPDGELIKVEKGKDLYTSPLESKKEEVLSSGKEIEALLKERQGLIKKFTEAGGKAEYLSVYQERISKVAKARGWDTYPAKWILGTWDPKDIKPENLQIMNEEVAILKEATKMLETYEGVLKWLGKTVADKVFGKENVDKMLEEARKTKITGIQIDQNGITVKGENIKPGQESLKVELPKDPLRIATSKSGQTEVDLIAQGMEGIGKQLKELIKAGIGNTLAARFTGINFNDVLSKISDDQMNQVIGGKLKDAVPELTVYGLASLEGGFERNMQIAKARAESAKSKILAGLPQEQRAAMSKKIKIQPAINILGEIVTKQDQIADAERRVVEAWNKEVAGQDAKLKVDKIDKIYQKLSNIAAQTGPEQAFLNRCFTEVRGAAVKVDLPSAQQNVEFAMKFEK